MSEEIEMTVTMAEEEPCVCCDIDGEVDAFCVNPFADDFKTLEEETLKSKELIEFESWPSVEEKFEAYITVAAVSAGLALAEGLQIFRYRSADDYYNDGDTLWPERNFWKIGNDLVRYSTFATGCLLALTNTLAAFSIAPIVNFLAVVIGGSIGNSFASTGYAGLAYAFDAAFVESRDNSSAEGASIYSAIKYDGLKWATLGLSIYSVARPIAEAYLYAFVDDSPVWFQEFTAEYVEQAKVFFALGDLAHY